MNSVKSGEVQFGVFLQGRDLQDWEWNAIELLRGAAAICLFILAPQDLASQRSSIMRVVDRLVHRVAGLPSQSREKVKRPPAHQEYEPLTILTVERTAEGEPALSPAEKTQLSSRRLKFILFFGAGDIPKGLPACAELGVWQFARSRGGAIKEYPFIRGLQRRDDVVSFGLEQVTEHVSRNRLLLNGHFRARGERNRSIAAQILSQASRWPLRVLKHFLLNGDLPCCAESGNGDDERQHSLGLLISLVSRDALLKLKSKLASYFVLETWNIGFAKMNFRTLLAGMPLSDVALLPRLELGRYIADPFILSTTPELTLLAEDYTDFGVGRISEVMVRDPFGTPEVSLKVRLESNHHMSYPFVLREEGLTYCFPECHQSNAAFLYRYDTGKLTPVTDLVPGARATDGTIFFHEGRYWLFCGLEDDNDQVNLYVFFSDTLRGDWTSHPLNPVKTDVRSSRSAGPVILHDGTLFRPAQDCSKSYGYGLSVNRIDHLTITRFEETVVARIRPEEISESCKGVHTLSFAGDLMVIDAKFHLVGFEPILVRALRRMKRMNNGLLSAVRP